MMDVGDPAGDRILDRDHGELAPRRLHRGKRVLEGGAGKRLHLRKSVAAGEMRVGAWLALIGDFLTLGCGHRSVLCGSLSCPRRRASSNRRGLGLITGLTVYWIPAFAGMTMAKR